MNKFGMLLTKLRVDRHMNYTQLGKKAGYDRKSIREWESGIINPPDDETVRCLCQALSVSKEEGFALFEAASDFYIQLIDQRYPTRRLIFPCKDPESPMPVEMISKALRNLKSPER